MRGAILALLLLAACRTETAALPEPATMTESAVGHFCQMNVLEHPGPKGQIWLKDVLSPLFFSQVRDVVAYQRMPEQSHEIVVAYVNDMSQAPSWEHPGVDNWMRAEDAFYVVGSARAGGMGAPEIVPFSQRADADAFADQHGGSVMQLAEIPDSAALAPVGAEPESPQDQGDYAARLRALSNEVKP
ncbi:nitrous oxide reductase accessory protein NosL [Paracoccus jeotgali]|uniref:Copper resistance protein CopZ n=1 Tax=Paracoccus jeotgali TaxID=2065379 RepID=A0A2K9MIB5_9RHOB|nr:nitrous oxide reductase accessory protein NosL [Paracoccus jeotgali]AUM75354.1 copper resistance protein CopZ [Paracoccus jeotgali]